ncbi:MAG: fructose-1,6-bisphosphate aldolase/phosphatase [Candidatus Bathyarchaeota archaeon]|nr:fructose-1,6-bisphosphate aldolase/phosphatase [Candidatus Bathyarchaeota archaeon]MDH5787402.1 fructose-1,6-bisphosphate aldolase/phosphatase [Candidatus Bathyarchaeota archaeon]
MFMPKKTTISLIKCDVGSLAGHYVAPKPLSNVAQKNLKKATEEGLINSYQVFNVGDDLQLLMIHERGESNSEIHKLAWDTFKEASNKALELKLYGAGQDLLKTAFSGNIRGMGPGVAEMEIEERGSDPIVALAADKTSAGAFNFPLFRIFADPMSTAGLVIDPNMTGGFKFEVLDTVENRSIVLKCPEEMYELLALIGTVQRYMISRVWRARDDLICATGSITRLSKIAGKYIGKDDPVMVVRAQHGLPALGEILVPFMHSYLVEGWMRGSHWGPIMPVGLKDAKCTVFDGPPRIVALGFQIASGKIASDDDGKPMIADLFDDPAFDLARHEALENASMLRRMGEFEPARLGPEEMEYTTLRQILKKLKKRFKSG